MSASSSAPASASVPSDAIGLHFLLDAIDHVEETADNSSAPASALPGVGNSHRNVLDPFPINSPIARLVNGRVSMLNSGDQQILHSACTHLLQEFENLVKKNDCSDAGRIARNRLRAKVVTLMWLGAMTQNGMLFNDGEPNPMSALIIDMLRGHSDLSKKLYAGAQHKMVALQDRHAKQVKALEKQVEALGEAHKAELEARDLMMRKSADEFKAFKKSYDINSLGFHKLEALRHQHKAEIDERQAEIDELKRKLKLERERARKRKAAEVEVDSDATDDEEEFRPTKAGRTIYASASAGNRKGSRRR